MGQPTATRRELADRVETDFIGEEDLSGFDAEDRAEIGIMLEQGLLSWTRAIPALLGQSGSVLVLTDAGYGIMSPAVPLMAA